LPAIACNRMVHLHSFGQKARGPCTPTDDHWPSASNPSVRHDLLLRKRNGENLRATTENRQRIYLQVRFMELKGSRKGSSPPT
jgi:hypothetical protein